MKRIILLLTLLFSMIAAACSDSDTYQMANCDPDEMAVDDECKSIPSEAQPAPVDEDK